MKKTVLVLLSVISLALTSYTWAGAAQRGPAQQRLTETLNLDQQQANQVAQILREQREKRQTLRDTLHTQRRADMQALQQETIERLRPVLSAEQLQKFLQLSEARRTRHQGDGSKPAPLAPAQ